MTVRVALSLLVAGLVVGAANGASGAKASFTPLVTGLDAPTYVTSAPGDPTTLYVVEQPGTIKIVRNGAVARTFLDIRSRVKSGGEQGLLSVAFSPQYPSNHRFYVDYTDTNGNTRVVEFRSVNGVGRPGTARQLLFVAQPYPNHNGGQLEFDRYGYLYVGMGDGGSGGDPGNRAQNLKSRLGKLLRINPARKGSTWQIVGFGLRNPWRFMFDRANGNLWIGDVGQDRYEEIDRSVVSGTTPAGRGVNYGWRVLEGRTCYNPAAGCSTAGKTMPLVVYPHSSTGPGNCAVTGGYVYRGSAYPVLVGGYVYGDYCSGRIWVVSATATAPATGTLVRSDTASPHLNISSFGESEAGELYVVDLNGSVYRVTARPKA